MTDYQTMQESDLEAPQAPSQPATDGAEGPSTVPGANYQTMSESDLAAPSGGPAGPTGEFAYKGIPSAAAARFKASNPLTNIFGAAVSRYANGWANDFAALTDADKATLVQNGYGNYSQGFPGSLLQHGADMLNSGLVLGIDGFMATFQAVPEAFAGAEGQIAREAGASEATAQSAEREGGGVGEAALSDVGAMHASAMLDVAKANAAIPGPYGHAYRFDVTPEGNAVSTPLGRFPDAGAEAVAQAQTAADALHLPPETATLIHQTYLDTGRPPAEVLLDAQTNHGGVLDDLVAGKQPTVYQGAPRPMTPEELAAAKPASQPVIGQPAGLEQVAGRITPERSPDVPQALPEGSERGLSKIGLSIEKKAIDQGVTDGFLQTAGYDVKTVKGQTALVEDLITQSPDRMHAIVNGEEALPKGMDPSMFIAGVESYIERAKDWDLQARLADSPVVSLTSGAAQTLRFAQERVPDSTTALLQQLKQENVKQAGGPAEVAKKQVQAKAALNEGTSGIFLPKEAMRWDKFLEEIKC